MLEHPVDLVQRLFTSRAVALVVGVAGCVELLGDRLDLGRGQAARLSSALAIVPGVGRRCMVANVDWGAGAVFAAPASRSFSTVRSA
jgi:hypothetical protein